MSKILTPFESNAYRQMLAVAYSQPSDVWYTTADLLSHINHTLDGNQQKYLGTKFSYYAKNKPHKFEIKRSKGNNKYRTRRDDK